FEFYFVTTLSMFRRVLSRCSDSSDLIDRGGVLCVSEKFLQAFSSGIYNFFTLFLSIYFAEISPLRHRFSSNITPGRALYALTQIMKAFSALN
ncbi:MAG: hypothetical protein ACI81O_002685, partial [Cyclobacteriaceae bacterium]